MDMTTKMISPPVPTFYTTLTELFENGFKLFPLPNRVVDGEWMDFTKMLRTFADQQWGQMLASEGFKGSLLDDEYWLFENYSELSRDSRRHNSIPHRETRLFKPENFVQEAVAWNRTLVTIPKKYGDSNLYIFVNGINRKEIGRAFNIILYEGGIRLMIVNRLNELKRWKDEGVGSYWDKYRTTFAQITLDRRIRSLFVMTLSLLGLGVFVFLVEIWDIVKLQVERRFIKIIAFVRGSLAVFKQLYIVKRKGMGKTEF